MSHEPDQQPGYFDDWSATVLGELRLAGIPFAITSTSTGVVATIGNERRSAREIHTTGDISSIFQWLIDTARELYPHSNFALSRESQYESPYAAASPEARAKGCVCPPPMEDGVQYMYTICPEHGVGSERMIGGQFITVADKPTSPSPYKPGSQDARAKGCRCSPHDDGEMRYALWFCPEHGYGPTRMIGGQLVNVGSYWRPDRSPRDGSKQ